MASDSNRDPLQELREELWAKDRNEYAADPAVWMDKLFSATRQEVRDQVKYYSEHQEEHAKSFLQTVADSHRRYLSGLEARLIFWLGIIAMIVSASAGLFGIRDGIVIGAIVVGLVVVGRVYWWRWLMRKRMNRFDKFRKRFRELLDSVNDPRWQTRTEEMVAKDKAFLEKYKDTILFPSVIPYERRERIWPDGDLGHVETLYIEYRFNHFHPWPDPNDPNSNTRLKCELCMTADRVRKHIESAISAYESAVESERQKLVARIDSVDTKGVMEDFQQWLPLWIRVREYSTVELKPRDEELCALSESLRDKDCWTFDEADKVRELCRKGKERFTRFDDLVDEVKLRDLSAQIFDKLSREMEAAATRCGLADTWDWYDPARERLANSEGPVADIRRIIGRHDPEAMFRELAEQFVDISVRLPGITKWGYDPKLVARERRIARRLISKERDKYDRERDRELQAARAFVIAEHRERE
ncbi:MAG: hypothetical protein ACREQ5_07760 [Candidatus Dormibacteria bacterium]